MPRLQGVEMIDPRSELEQRAFEETGLKYEATVIGVPYEAIEEMIELNQIVSLAVGRKKVAVILVGAFELFGRQGIKVRAKGVRLK